jgi:hypothetical protein
MVQLVMQGVSKRDGGVERQIVRTPLKEKFSNSSVPICTECLKKSFTNSKDYINLFREHV